VGEPIRLKAKGYRLQEKKDRFWEIPLFPPFIKGDLVFFIEKET